MIYMANIICKSWKGVKVEIKKKFYRNCSLKSSQGFGLQIEPQPTRWQYPLINYLIPVEPPKQTKEPVSDDDKNKVVLSKNSGIFMYVDIHGHASKRGIFM